MAISRSLHPTAVHSTHGLRSPTALRSSRRRLISRCAAIRAAVTPAVVGEPNAMQQSNWLSDTTAKCVNFVIDLRLRSSLGFI